MKAVIMAGGEGTRLRPLTCTCPKPMVPVLDRPVMAYALELIADHGIRDAAVTLMYLPRQIMDYFGDGADYHLRLTYYTEEKPLGTAGSVRQAADMLDETTIVLSGDGLTDCDLTKAYAFHKEKGALATLVLKKVKSPLEYGVVLTDGQGRVIRFVEKPGWGEVCSDAVNTGIYILEPEVIQMIPKDRAYDFGRELFPRMVREGMAVYGYVMEEYWCDIGDAAAYLRAHADVLDGRMKTSLRPGAVNRMPGAIIDRSAVLEAPCYIGAGARVEAGARVGPYSTLGAGSRVGQETSIKRSVLMRGARVEALCQLRGAVLQQGCHVMKRACAFEESVLGEGSVLGENSTLMPGVRVWPRKTVHDGEKLDQNLVWGGQTQRMVEGAFFVNGPMQLIRQTQAYAETLKAREILLARDESAVALALERAALSALMAQGIQAIDVGAASIAQARYAQNVCRAQGVLHISRDRILPMGKGGALLNRDQQRKLMGLMVREDYAAPFSEVTHLPQMMSGTDRGYIQSILDKSGARCANLKNRQIALYCQHEQILSLAESAFRRAGCMVRAEWEEDLMELAPGEIGLWFGDSGESVSFADAQGMIVEPDKTLLLCWAALESGENPLVLPKGTTPCVRRLAQMYSAQIDWTASGDAAWQQGLAARSPGSFGIFFDGIQAALTVLTRLEEKGETLRGLLEKLPSAVRRTQVIPVPLRDKGLLLKRLSRQLPQADLSDGLTLEKESGWAWINPGGDKKQCVVTAEAVNAEFAKELCDFCCREVEHALEQE